MSIYLKIIPIGLCIFAGLISASLKAETNSIDFSGFSRVVAGILDDKNATYKEYDDSVSFAPQSLLGIQVEGHITANWSVTTQLLAHTSNEKESSLNWLYTTYQATDALQFKFGKLRTPFFNYSDFKDVGYAYPWISPPQQVYNGFLFDSYEGASASYELVEDNFSINTEAYWGQFQDEITIGGRTVAADVNQIRGIILSIQFDNLKLRLSSHSGNANIELPEITGFADTLNQVGYSSMANQLETAGAVNVYQISLNYDALAYFIKSEAVQISSSILVFPDIDSYYLSAGYVHYPFTIHATFASSQVSYSRTQSTIRPGLAPELDTLSSAFDALYDNLVRDNLDSIGIGLRWDFKSNMALKIDLTRLLGKKNESSFFTISDAEAFNHKANLVQVAWEWVF